MAGDDEGRGQGGQAPSGRPALPDGPGAADASSSGKVRETVPNASIRDVAARAGVSIASVSRALQPGSKGISSATRARVQDAANALNYRPNRIGRALRAQRTDTYALIISNIQNSFYTAVAWDLERELMARDKVMLLFNSNEDPVLQDKFLDELVARQVSGIFTLCAVESPGLRSAAQAVPIVLINRRVASEPDLSFIGIDDYAAGREVMTSALRHSTKRFGIIHGPAWSPTSTQRVRGVLDALRQRGRAPDPADIIEVSLTMDGGYQGACRILGDARLHDGIFCGNDAIAYGVHRRCRELGIGVPDELRIYGFDDNPLNEWLAPWLNTVRVPHAAYASEAVREMNALHEGAQPSHIQLPYDILLRM